jgi:phosphoglycerate dehydrogenase-like enzyme
VRILRCSLDPAEAAAALREHLPEHEIVLGPPEEIPSLVSDADVIVSARFPLDADLLQRAKRCRLIQQMGAGIDMVDLDAAESLEIPVANAPGDQTGGADSVAEWALWLTDKPIGISFRGRQGQGATAAGGSLLGVA